jgi:Txe/YoeB family toxin of Txe-Axe toxin-antitoxin module
MRLLWEDRAWNDYLYWQTQDKKTLKKINGLSVSDNFAYFFQYENPLNTQYQKS